MCLSCNLEKNKLASHAVADYFMTVMRRIYSEIGFKLFHIAAFSCKARVGFLLMLPLHSKPFSMIRHLEMEIEIVLLLLFGLILVAAF